MQFVEVLFYFGNFMIKKCVEFSITSFGSLKHYCVIKTNEMFNFLYLIKNLLTTVFLFLVFYY